MKKSKKLREWFFRWIIRFIPEDIIKKYLSDMGFLDGWLEEKNDEMELKKKEEKIRSGFDMICFKNVQVFNMDKEKEKPTRENKFVFIVVYKDEFQKEMAGLKFLSIDKIKNVKKIKFLEAEDGKTEVIFFDENNNEIYKETRYVVITCLDSEERAFAEYLKGI